MKNLLFLCAACSVFAAPLHAMHDSRAKACIDIQDDDGDTVLMRAALHGQTKIAMFLIAAGAKLNVQDLRGNTALIKAASCGNSDIVRLLIEAKADLTLKNRLGGTALIEASVFGQTEAVKLLIPAMQAAYEARLYAEGCTFTIDTLRQQMIDDLIHPLDIQDTAGRTALMEAALYGHVNIVKLLIAAGADATILDNDGYTACFLVSHSRLTHKSEIFAALAAQHIALRSFK
jgi:ankyrin repeat protein